MAERKGGKALTWIIFGLLCLGLVGFGATGLTGTLRTLGTVGDKSIPVQQYANALNDRMRTFGSQIGQPIDINTAQMLGIDRMVLQEIITTRTLDNEADRLGLSVGDARVAQQVVAMPAFQGFSGGFDRDGYREALRRSGISESDFEATIREDITRILLQGAVAGGVSLPDTFGETMLNYLGETRDITWGTVASDPVGTPIPAPSEDDLAAFHDANPDAFTLPETRRITYAWLTPDMIQNDIALDEGELRALYQQRINEFVLPERRLVERLVYLSNDLAGAAMARIDADEVTFDELVTERGLDLSSVDLGDVTPGELGAAGEAVFAAEPGSTVGPFDTNLGPAIFRVNAVLSAQEVSFEEAEPDLRRDLGAAAARRQINLLYEDLNDLIAGGAGPEDLAGETDLVLGTIDWHPGLTDGIAAYERFRTEAAGLADARFPELGVLEDGGIFVARLDEIVPPALQPMDEVRDLAEELWRADALRQATLQQAARLADEIANGADFAALIPTTATEQGLTRRDFVLGAPPEFMAEVFAMTPGEVRSVASGEGAVVVRVDALAPADLTNPTLAAESTALADRATAGLAQDIFAAFSIKLAEQTPIAINENALASVNSQLSGMVQ